MSHFNNQSRNADKFVVRLPDGLRDKIAALASSHHRSMNSEIVTHLERAVDDSTAIPNDGPMAQSNDEVRILNAFRKLPAAKQAAALALLGGDQ